MTLGNLVLATLIVGWAGVSQRKRFQVDDASAGVAAIRRRRHD